MLRRNRGEVIDYQIVRKDWRFLYLDFLSIVLLGVCGKSSGEKENAI
jgi:hypothetical protein